MDKVTDGRDGRLDFFKGMLVIGMILSHTLGLLSNVGYSPINEIRYLMKLVTFSAFLFAFGITTQIAYFSKKIDYRKVCVSCSRLLIAFYISGIAFEFFIRKTDVTLQSVLKILLLFQLPGYSEFLIAYCLTLAIASVLIKQLEKIVKSKRLFTICMVGLFSITFLPVGWVHWSQLSLFIGSNSIRAFPVVHYFPLFLMGMFVSYHKIVIDWKIGAGAFIGGILCFGYKILGGEVERFPPSLAWVVGSLCLTVVYFFLSNLLYRYSLLRHCLIPVGVNSLIFLLISNILLFSIKGSYPEQHLSFTSSLMLTIGILAFVLYTISIVRPKRLSL